MQKLVLFLLALAGGFILSLSIPNIEVGIIPYIALIPSFFIIKYTKTYKGAFFLGWVVGITGVFFGFNWLIHTITTFGGTSIPNWSSYPIFILYCIVFSLKFPLFHIFVKLINKHLSKIPLIILFPIILTATEFLVPELFPFHFGNIMHKNLLAMQIIEITGISGMTFFIGLSNALIFTIISYFFPKFTKTPKRKQFPYVIVSIGLIIVIGIHVFGYFRMQTIESIANEKEDITIGFIQPNTPMPLEDFNNLPAYSDRQPGENRTTYSKRKCIELTYKILNKNPDLDLIIWPESAASFFYRNRNNNFIKQIKDIIKKYDIPMYINDFDMNEYSKEDYEKYLEFTKIRYDEEEYEKRKKQIENNKIKLYNIYNNSDLVIPPDGKVKDSYRKVFLLAFGEYNPFKNTILEKLFPVLRDFMEGSGISNATPGNEFKILSFDSKNRSYNFAPQICYEIIIPSFTRQFTSLEADFIINATNDRWFGVSKASMQHLLLGMPRTIENRMYMIRSTNSGISSVLSATGKNILFESKNGDNTIYSPLYEEDYMIAKIKPLNINTFYKSYGDVFAWLISILGLVGLVLAIIKIISKRIKSY